MSSKVELGAVPTLEERGTFEVPIDHNCLRFDVEWQTKSYGLICDLDLVVYCYDERARFIEILDGGSKRTTDGSCVLLADQDSASTTSNVFKESLKIDFRLVDKETTAILLYLDGGPRNFQFVQSINTTCNPIALRANVPGQAPPPALVQFGDKTKKEYQGVSMCVLYKDGFIEGTEQPLWMCKRLVEPSFTSNKKAKEEMVSNLVVANVPSLEKFKPRLFSSVNEICACLSSAALPKLKKKFTAYSGGLQMGRFTEVIFKQLYTKFPQIADTNESAYTVAMIQEMFQQIDYNGDGGADWDEFTTFCIQTASEVQGAAHPQGVAMDEYIIEYAEDSLRRDTVLSPYRQAALMRFISAERRFLIIPDEADKVVLMDERFRVRGEINPYNIQIKNTMGVKEEDPNQVKTAHKIMIYDVIYLENKELYAFSASDHSITIVREQGGVGNRKASQVLYNRLFHDLLHLKLCWSNRHDLLCSVSSTRVIYGWKIDKTLPVFQVSRHSDIVTDFISVDSMDVFVTCSMDKKIVMWSATSRRVKGIFLGHKRGVRSVCVHETTMLSAGFEADARTWDLNTKENIAILKGHRFPIVAAKLMCDMAHSERDYRAVTVDEGGEIRLWNIFVKERTSSAIFVPTLQVFEMSNPVPPTKYIRFLAIPCNPHLSTSYYSNLVTMGTKMMNFIPEKNSKEFVPPSAAEFNSTAAELATCVGKSLYKYDVCKGSFSSVLSNLYTSDLCSICLDGPRGRRMYIGTGNGDVLLVNYLSGQIIDKADVHKKEVNSICCYTGTTRNSIFTASADGSISILEETHGNVNVHNLIENVFGEGIGAASIKVAPSIMTMFALSTTTKWGIWNSSTGKKIGIFNEASVVSSCEIIGASRDADDLKYLDENFSKFDKSALLKREKEKLLSVAIATVNGVSIYTMDVGDMRGVNSYFLSFDRSVFMTSLQLLSYPNGDSVNYAANAKASTKREQARILSGLNLMATTDDGYIIVWDSDSIRAESERIFRKRFRESNQTKSKGKSNMFITQENAGEYGGVKESKEEDALSRPGTADSVNTAGTAESSGTNESGLDGSVTGDVSLASSVAPFAENDSSTFFVKVDNHGQSFLVKSKPILFWLAHKDTISVAVPMHEHSCMVTISHDGFHRVWNLDKACLGEMQLPNLTDKMKKPKDPILEKAAWKFILEKMEVTDVHRELAYKLVEMVTKYKEKGRGKQRRSATHTGGVHADDIAALQNDKEEGNASNDEQEQLRKMALESMVEEIGPRDDGPPLTLPSDDELRLQLLQDKLEAHRKKTHGKHNYIVGDEETGTDNDSEPDPELTRMLQGLRPPDDHSTSTSQFSDLPAKIQPKLLPPSQVVSPIKTKPHFGVNTKKALWSIASDNLKDNPSVSAIAPAFSEDSLALSMSEGFLDEESHSLLRGVSLDRNKVHQYSNNKKGVVLLRSPSLSTSIELPALESMRRAEVSFGPQKDYYKNAEKFLNERDNIKKDKMRHAITLARIENNVKRLGSMIHLVDPLQVDDVAIPDDNQQKEFQKKLDMQNRKMQLRLMASHNTVENESLDQTLRPLDKDNISKILGKVDAAINPALHDEWDLKYSQQTKKHKTAQNLPREAKEQLEKKVRAALRDEYNARVRREEKQKENEVAKLMRLQNKEPEKAAKDGKEKEKKVALDTRALLPYYKGEDVRYFMDIFTKVDEDFSGDLDMNEWIKLFSTLSSGVSVQEARSIFMKFKNEDGLLTVNELVPVVFNKATKDQHKMIIKFCQAEIMKSVDEMTYLSFNDIDSFFETLDDSNLGFVAVSTIRDKIRSFALSESCIIGFLNTFKDIEDDEMVNHIEFGRLFKGFISKADLESQRKDENNAREAQPKSKRK